MKGVQFCVRRLRAAKRLARQRQTRPAYFNRCSSSEKQDGLGSKTKQARQFFLPLFRFRVLGYALILTRSL